jgi:hypothetical protein
MPFKHHPSEALILSVFNGTASADDRSRVSAHFTVCARCRTVSEHKGMLLRELSDFSRSSSQRMQVQAEIKTLSFPKRRISKPAAFGYAGAALAATLLILLFAWPRHIQTVSAAELLSRAETAEIKTASARRFYRLYVGSTTCDTADANWSAPVNLQDNPCDLLHGKLRNTDWDEGQMLSAHSYRKWHDALARHTDSVLHQEPYWTLRTDTDQGSLRSASLRVRSSDYRPVELTLEFSTLQPVSVFEDEPTERHIHVPSATPDQLAKSETSQRVDEPADAIEVQAWNMLRALGADSGWEATITRKGGEVRVVGYVNDASRRDKFEQGFSKLEGVTLDLDRPGILPQRGSNGDAQPLAEHTLETLIPDSHERGERVTEISDASRTVVGKAYIYDRLLARRNALQESTSAHALDPLIEEERRELLTATLRLSNLLEPLIETSGNHSLHAPLSYSQARTLDGAVLSLVNAAPRQSASLAETTSLVRSLLSKN